MAAKNWTDKAWDELVVKYPTLETKPEGVAFCAFAIEQGIEALPDIRELAKSLGIKLKFSGASVGSAKVAMGKKKPARRGKGTKAKAKTTAKAKKGGGTGKPRGRPRKTKGVIAAGDVKAMVAGLLENLAAEIEDARGQYEEGLGRLEKVKGSFSHLQPVFEEYQPARAKKLAGMLADV